MVNPLETGLVALYLVFLAGILYAISNREKLFVYHKVASVEMVLGLVIRVVLTTVGLFYSLPNLLDLGRIIPFYIIVKVISGELYDWASIYNTLNCITKDPKNAQERIKSFNQLFLSLFTGYTFLFWLTIGLLFAFFIAQQMKHLFIATMCLLSFILVEVVLYLGIYAALYWTFKDLESLNDERVRQSLEALAATTQVV
jgi:hypothetical protein